MLFLAPTVQKLLRVLCLIGFYTGLKNRMKIDVLETFFLCKLLASFPLKIVYGLYQIQNPNLGPLYLPRFSSDFSIFSAMEYPLKVFQLPTKFPLNLLPVSHNKRSNFGSHPTQGHRPSNFGSKWVQSTLCLKVEIE